MRAPFRQSITNPSRVVDSNSRIICDADGEPLAGRIVECLNALDGIAEPASMVKLWQAHIGAQHDSLGRAADALQAAKVERDEMLRAMREARQWIGVLGTDRPHTLGDIWRVAERIDEAIAKVPA